MPAPANVLPVIITAHALSRYRLRIAPYATMATLLGALAVSREATPEEMSVVSATHPATRVRVHDRQMALFLLVPSGEQKGAWTLTTVLHRFQLDVVRRVC